jgi:hypothetical protein
MMSDYAAKREKRRLTSLWVLPIVVIAVTSAFSTTTSEWLLVIPVVMLLVFAWIYIRSRRPKRSISDLKANGLSAQLPAWVIKNAGVEMKMEVRDTGELIGRLRATDDQLEWIPNPRFSHQVDKPVVWSASDIARLEITPIWGLTPMCLLHVDGRPKADIWVRSDSASARSLLDLIAPV